MRVSAVAVILGAVGLSCASTRSVVHEKRDVVPARWTRTRKVDADLVLPMRIGCVSSSGFVRVHSSNSHLGPPFLSPCAPLA